MITIEQILVPITIEQKCNKIIIQQNPFPQITVQGVPVMTTIAPFSFTATINGQTQFTLPVAPSIVICLFIMGTGQDQIAGDFTINGQTITLGNTAPYINAGDLIFGAYQI